MATTTELIHSEALGKIAAVPLVATVLAFIISVINAHPILERTYKFGDAVVAKTIQTAQPVINLVTPQLKYIDNTAANVIGYVERKFPYPFQIKPAEIAQYVESQKQYGVNVYEGYKSTVEKTYDNHVVVPTRELLKQVGAKYDKLQSDSVPLQKANATIASIYEQLNGTVQEINKRAQSEVTEQKKKIEPLTNRLFSDLDNLHKFALSLPTEGQKRIEPIIVTFNDTYKELYKEALQSNGPINERVGNLVNYLREKTIPALKNVVFTQIDDAQKGVKSVAQSVVDNANAATEAVTNKASEATKAATDKASEVTGAVTGKANEIYEATTTKAGEAIDAVTPKSK
ncbi:hypothetical protein MCUN1_000572 [Malassezia cuniculi]|uniref:Uncharacterized protein n=1 Tax=Malassezia cuniculi TaxID=948313 RepID=A0AAF0ERF9_9BASI|nr:hypothetical protein MCUN1_000572 [Malassezia cuniculi]